MTFTYRRALFALLAIALLACLYVAAKRGYYEHATRHVELTMDYNDLAALARSYGYDQEQFLIALRRAGLTSLALTEELGSSLPTSSDAVAFAGQALLNTARISTIGDPTLAALVRSHSVKTSEVYLVVYREPTFRRYVRELPIRFGPSAVRVVHGSLPFVVAIKTQSDFFAATGLGIPEEQYALARRLGVLIDPRVQNDERYKAPQIDAIFDSFAHRGRIGSVIFFGVRNQALGFPAHMQETAAAFRREKRVFGLIETYDKNQVQKGSESLGLLIPGQTTRVQAIAKAELDKLDFETVIARYLLGVRERNVRVVYLRPFAHEIENRSIQATNVEMVRRLADGLRARGFTTGRATPIPPYKVNSLVIFIASLAVPAIVLLILEALGYRRRRVAVALCVADLLLLGAGYAIHHDIAVRKLLALVGGIAFPVAAALAIAPAFRARARQDLGASILAGLRVLAIAVGVTLGGALVIIGLLSTPALMEEIDRFTGVKAVLIVPPLVILALYWTTSRFGSPLESWRAALASPVRIAQLLVLAIVVVGGYLLLARSGNQSDIAPSAFELAFRANLTAWLSVRPRFKEFVVGFPLLMLLPNLAAVDRRAIGWLIALGIGVGLADVVDTFSHLHTSLDVSLVRIVLGVLAGSVFGIVAIVAYRWLRRPLAQETV